MRNAFIIWLLFGIAGVIWAQYCDVRDRRIQNEWKVERGWAVTDDDPFVLSMIVPMVIATALGPIWFGIVYMCEHDRIKTEKET